jgi:hypothetical protein
MTSRNWLNSNSANTNQQLKIFNNKFHKTNESSNNSIKTYKSRKTKSIKAISRFSFWSIMKKSSEES